MDVFCVSSLFYLHHSDQVQWVLCLISMIHSMMLPLFLLYSCLLLRREREEWFVSGCIWWVFYLYSQDWVLWVLCLFSKLHSIFLPLFLQCDFPLVVMNQMHNKDTLAGHEFLSSYSWLTCQIEFSTGNDVHHKYNTLNHGSFLNTPYRTNTNMSFLF